MRGRNEIIPHWAVSQGNCLLGLVSSWVRHQVELLLTWWSVGFCDSGRGGLWLWLLNGADACEKCETTVRGNLQRNRCQVQSQGQTKQGRTAMNGHMRRVHQAWRIQSQHWPRRGVGSLEFQDATVGLRGCNDLATRQRHRVGWSQWLQQVQRCIPNHTVDQQTGANVILNRGQRVLFGRLSASLERLFFLHVQNASLIHWGCGTSSFLRSRTDVVLGSPTMVVSSGWGNVKLVLEEEAMVG
jgi:hypothetical protein